ncbi:MAG: hypothetical protein JO257_26900, partial [Deltaproteobacteria bacterium]|nr:hypothetical protein [Deltaproteobacteria bacterium]
MAAEEGITPIEMLGATIVVAVLSPAAEAVAAELRRDSLRIQVVTADVLRSPAAAIVYVFWFDAALGVALADRIVQWSNATETRAGLIGVIPDGGGNEREALLAAGF